MGPATVYYAPFGTAAPLDANINATPAASAWTDLGGTNGGVSTSIDPKFTDFEVDQIVDTPGSRLTSRSIMVTTVLAEVTLQNLATALNTTIGATGANYAKVQPNYGQFASQLPYISLLVDGWAPTGATLNVNWRARLWLPKILQTGKIEWADAKDKQKGLSVQFQAYYVSNTTPPFDLTYQTA